LAIRKRVQAMRNRRAYHLAICFHDEDYLVLFLVLADNGLSIIRDLNYCT
jgi:hypothetical protein